MSLRKLFLFTSSGLTEVGHRLTEKLMGYNPSGGITKNAGGITKSAGGITETLWEFPGFDSTPISSSEIWTPCTSSDFRRKHRTGHCGMFCYSGLLDSEARCPNNAKTFPSLNGLLHRRPPPTAPMSSPRYTPPEMLEAFHEMHEARRKPEIATSTLGSNLFTILFRLPAPWTTPTKTRARTPQYSNSFCHNAFSSNIY
jgi:hypothetical protein